MSTALIFGANGISGIALIKFLSARPSHEWRKIIAVSRRPPVLDHADERVSFVSVDLLGPVAEIVTALSAAKAEEATHVFFYAYVAKADEQELIAINEMLFANGIDAVSKVCKTLKVFQLQTGTKYYGCHRGGKYLAPYPWRESASRHEGQNFYYMQEDMLEGAAKKHGWRWLVTRPNFIIGASKGNFMSIAVTVALYATACKAFKEPLVFPGSSATWNLPYDHSTAHVNAEFQVFIAQNEKAYDQAFNIHDGAPMSWGQLWPKIASYFGVALPEPPADAPPSHANIGAEFVVSHPAVQWAKDHEQEFPAIANKLGMDAKAFEFATWDFLDYATGRTWKDVASLEKARLAGWTKESDVWQDGWLPVFDDLRKLRIIP